MGEQAHSGVTCDGCGAEPLRGPRFTCQSCENYDLCSGCYLKHSTLQGGRCAGHSFQCKPFGLDVEGCGRLLYKGLGKGKGFGKGMCGKSTQGATATSVAARSGEQQVKPL